MYNNIKKKIDLVILAGGKGTRISNFTKKTPKPLIKFDGKPILQYIFNYFSKFNFDKIFILAGYKGNQIYKKYNNKIINLAKVKVVIEKEPLDTFGAVLNIKKFIQNDFVLVNGDTIIDFNFRELIKIKSRKKLSIILNKNHNYKKNKKLNNITVDTNNNVIFSKHNSFMSGGVYFVSKILIKKKKKKSSIENDLIPELIQNKEIKGLVNNKKFFIDIGTYSNLKKGGKKIPDFFKKPAIILDRDGVINHDYGYVHKYKNFRFRNGVIKALKFLSEKNIYIFIVTNQGGIGKGYYSIKDFFKLQKKINVKLYNKNIYINDVKFSPFHPKAIILKYKKNSQFRKPGNLMIEELFSEWNIIRGKSFMIGDSVSDKEAALKSNLYFEFVKPNLLKQVRKICKNLRI
jgi:D,D-heptose 1,7-bisphosphate phosphatase